MLQTLIQSAAFIWGMRGYSGPIRLNPGPCENRDAEKASERFVIGHQRTRQLLSKCKYQDSYLSSHLHVVKQQVTVHLGVYQLWSKLHIIDSSCMTEQVLDADAPGQRSKCGESNTFS